MAKGKAKKEKKEKRREKTENPSENASDMLLNCKPQAQPAVSVFLYGYSV